MGIERLLLCVRLCNVCGLIPFRMVLDEQTFRFKRFERNWKHPSNWWFTFLCVGFIVFIFPFAYFNYTFIPGEGGKITIFFIGVLALYFFNYLFLVSIPRLFLLRFNHFETALETLDKIDRFMAGKMRSVPACTARLRTFIGIGIISAAVCFILKFKSKKIVFNDFYKIRC